MVWQSSFLTLSCWLPVKGWRRTSRGCRYFKSSNCQLRKWFTCKKIRSIFSVILGKFWLLCSYWPMMSAHWLVWWLHYFLLSCFVQWIAGYWSYKGVTGTWKPCQWFRSCHLRRDGKLFLPHYMLSVGLDKLQIPTVGLSKF